MKKLEELKSMSEPCLTMNIYKVVSNLEGKNESSIENTVELEFNSSNIKPEDTRDDKDAKDSRKSPPLQSLGPGAEIKGKLCHPIPSSSKTESLDSNDEGSKPIPAGVTGGRLTFFREGRPLLELSHRTDQGSAWVQVKSKTYWPPSSTTTTTATQHPLRHDTPTTHSASDDCSSMNSSPWLSDHIRKQVGPNVRITVSSEELFYIKSSHYCRALRRKVRLRRDPFYKIVGPLNVDIDQIPQSSSQCNHDNKDIKLSDRKKRLEAKLKRLHEAKVSKVDFKVSSVHTLFEKVDDSYDPTFVSPRKRYLRLLEGDSDSHSRKKVHSSYKLCDRPSSSSPSFHTPHKSAINHSQNNSSSYSIDSLLGNESDSKKNESFLRNLLKPELKSRSSPKPGVGRDRSHEVTNNHHYVKHERGSSPYRKEADLKKTDLGLDMPRYSPHQLQSLYLNPYPMDPRYMMLHPFLPQVSQPGETALAAMAAAASAGYNINNFNPLQISALAAGNPLLSASLCSPFASSSSPQLMRSPSSSTSRSLPHSPKPPSLPQHFPRVSSPRENHWSPSSFSNSSPQKLPNESAISPPPQDVPLNLSKPKGKS